MPFQTSISVYPWGLLLLAILLVQLGLLYFRDRARHRLAEEEPVELAVPVPVPVPVASTVPVMVAGSTASRRWQEPVRWAKAEWLAGAAALRRVLHRIRAESRPATMSPAANPEGPTPGRTQPAWVAAAAAWGSGMRNHGEEPAGRSQPAPPKKKAPAAPPVIAPCVRSSTRPSSTSAGAT